MDKQIKTALVVVSVGLAWVVFVFFIGISIASFTEGLGGL